MALLLPGAADAVPSPPLCLLPPLRSLVVVAGGGRDLTWSSIRVAQALFFHSGGRIVHGLFHGGARGADQAIAAAAERLGWPAEAVPAQWARYGVAAGPVRNRVMLQRAITTASARSGKSAISACGVLVIAFPGHRGTASLLEQARRLQAGAPMPLLLRQVQG
jgi:hypothetical protein